MTVWLAFVLGGIVTYLWRGSFLLFGDRVRLPSWTQAPLRYVAPAAFAAIAVPATLGDEGVGALVPPTPDVVGVLVAVLVVGKWRSVPAGLVVGVAGYALVSWMG